MPPPPPGAAQHSPAAPSPSGHCSTLPGSLRPQGSRPAPPPWPCIPSPGMGGRGLPTIPPPGQRCPLPPGERASLATAECRCFGAQGERKSPHPPPPRTLIETPRNRSPLQTSSLVPDPGMSRSVGSAPEKPGAWEPSHRKPPPRGGRPTEASRGWPSGESPWQARPRWVTGSERLRLTAHPLRAPAPLPCRVGVRNWAMTNGEAASQPGYLVFQRKVMF